jgi:predicted DCC family thiol-disulfide oxidoreductase YuxK
MKNDWTGGQYSVFRGLLSLYLVIHFLYLTPWASEVFSSSGMLPQAALSPLTRAFPNILAILDGPAFVTGLCLSAALAAVALALGTHDRIAALWIWYVLACLFGRNPLIQNPSLPYLGWMLLFHAACPSAPYGSLAARGNVEASARWRLPPPLYAAAWVVLAVSYSYSGLTKLGSPTWVAGETVTAVLGNPLARDWIVRDLVMALPAVLLKLVTWFILVVEVLFAPLCLSRRLRPWAWSAMLLVQLGFALLLNFPDLTMAMLLVHLLTFDPAWIKGKSLTGAIVFFDGDCVLCHGFVRFLLAEDRANAVRIAPLDGATFAQGIGARPGLPVSMIVRTADGRILLEDAALLHLLAGLGGLWGVIGKLLLVAPGAVRQQTYRAIGDRRIRWFGRPPAVCPLLPDEVRPRLLA